MGLLLNDLIGTYYRCLGYRHLNIQAKHDQNHHGYTDFVEKLFHGHKHSGTPLLVCVVTALRVLFGSYWFIIYRFNFNFPALLLSAPISVISLMLVLANASSGME
ncbi:hypothetical protein [Mariprofundus ferrooxydans]|uniref:hypothetical protein n=1 Tax=Mariprofundus ferrooxydans TaxID=314344 RepID=UPI001E38A020|nr:hypothetical protein [Mariprofundus ferrooxydans]